MNEMGKKSISETKKANKKPTTPSIPKRSPIQVLTRPYVDLLRWSDENRCIQRGMVVGDRIMKNNEKNEYIPCDAAKSHKIMTNC